jgi:hypothetical protein
MASNFAQYEAKGLYQTSRILWKEVIRDIIFPEDKGITKYYYSLWRAVKDDDKDTPLKISKSVEYNTKDIVLEDSIDNLVNDFKKKNNDDSEEPEIFDIVPTILSKEILGFVNNCTTKNKYVADKTWDLRIEDKIYLFINNINESVPLGVLYLGNQAVQQFRFEEPVNLDRLELHFKDSKGRPFNFYSLTYSLNIQLEINDIDDNQLTLQ